MILLLILGQNNIFPLGFFWRFLFQHIFLTFYFNDANNKFSFKIQF